MKLSIENYQWLQKCRSVYGRSPRVLHIGNIANNAYNNAKLLNEAGLDCDVICYDYYHTMGCPEWEDADFCGDYGDPFRPDWKRVDLKEFQRPEWFAQGPFAICQQYLVAKRTQSPMTENYRIVSLASSLCVEASAMISSYSKYIFLLLNLRRRIAELLRYLKNKAKRYPSILKIYRKIYFLFTYINIYDRLAAFKHRRFILGLSRQYQAEFPKKTDHIQYLDICGYFGVIDKWSELLSNYDYVIAYSTDPILPLLCKREYFAFEHGTIREIPYENTSRGKLAALAYRKAAHVFVTNIDCVASAEFLAPGRFTTINHPYDEDHGQSVFGWEKLRTDLLVELDSEFIFFHPTRQDWVAGTGYADKNNEIFLNAFIELRRNGYKIGLVCCEWGSNVAESKQLLKDADCDTFVKWTSPLAIIPFERMCLASDIIVDQFKLGAFGGVLFKAMAVGRPILTYLDEEQISRQYPECPPVINCRTKEEIVAAMTNLVSSSKRIKELGCSSREWIKKHHSKSSVVNAQIDQFRLLEKRFSRKHNKAFK